MKLDHSTVRQLDCRGAQDDFENCGTGIVHFGPGAFHRAHQAIYTHDVLKKHGGNWRILAVSLQSSETAERLNAQDGMYSLVVRGETETEIRIIKSLKRVETAVLDTQPIFDALASPETHIVSMTVTEKAYGILRQKGKVDEAHESIAHDLKNPDAPKGIVGMIVKGLGLRHEKNLRPFTVLCCDNLPQNGALLKSGVLDFARRIGKGELADWIEREGAFPSSMVDRITPATTDALLEEVATSIGLEDTMPVVTEPFSQWVIEDSFCSKRPAWEDAGVLFVDDVEPYERMKLRMLNGTHSLIAYMGFLKGHAHVCDVLADGELLPLIQLHLAAAAATLEPLEKIDFSDYAKHLVARFSNSNILHETYQIAMDGSQKMPQRIFEPAQHALENGQSLDSFARATACWIGFCRGSNANGQTYALRDPREKELMAAFKSGEGKAEKITQAFFEIPELFPDRLSTSTEWKMAVTGHLNELMDHGILSQG